MCLSRSAQDDDRLVPPAIHQKQLLLAFQRSHYLPLHGIIDISHFIRPTKPRTYLSACFRSFCQITTVPNVNHGAKIFQTHRFSFPCSGRGLIAAQPPIDRCSADLPSGVDSEFIGVGSESTPNFCQLNPSLV